MIWSILLPVTLTLFIVNDIEMLEEAGDACSIDSLSLSLSCRQEKSCDEKHGRRNSIKPLGGEKNRRSSVLSIKRDEDDESCVSSLSNDSYRGNALALFFVDTHCDVLISK